MINSISLCMVVYNEAHRIVNTLTDAALFVDEVVIVDQQSSDDTIGKVWDWHESATGNPNTKVLSDKHWGYCEPSRKLAHEHATGEWILVLDADERISPDFAREIRRIDTFRYSGVRLKRSLWISGEHRFTGDYQYRYFHKNAVRYLDEIHTEPQPTISKNSIYSPDYVGIFHQKSWVEQIRDEEAYEKLLEGKKGSVAEAQRELNVHLKLLREYNLTPEEADAMSIEERNALGIGAG